MAFQYFTNPTFGRKKRGIFGEDTYDNGQPFTVKPTLGDPETSAYIAAKYPEKSEFNDAWVRQREGADSDYPNIIQTDVPPMVTTVPAPAMPEEPVFNVPPGKPNVIESPASLSPYETAENKYEQAVIAPVKKQPLGKQILFQVLQAVGNVANGTQNAEFLGNAKKRFAVEQAGREFAPLQQQEAIKRQADFERARTANIYADNELNADRLAQQKDLTTERLKSTALGKLNTLKTYDPKNQAMRRLAEQAGLDPDSVGGWDFRNPVEHSINGVRFRLNRETGKYEQTDLPADEEKQLVDFTTKDGKKYRVSAKTAATLQTQFDTLGMRQQFQQDENEKDRKFRLTYQAIDQQFRAEQRAFEQAQREVRDAKSAEEKLAAEQRAEESKKRILDYQKQLEQEMLIYKKENK